MLTFGQKVENTSNMQKIGIFWLKGLKILGKYIIIVYKLRCPTGDNCILSIRIRMEWL